MDHLEYFVLHNPKLGSKRNNKIDRSFESFLQKLVNRRYVGGLRYEIVPKREKEYMRRLGLEYQAYKKTGNYEHLLNIAVYCYLESYAPQNKKFHFDNTVESVTRIKKKGSKEWE